MKEYTDKAIAAMKGRKAETGDEWVADEMVLKVGGCNVWHWNVMDAKTRYILATHLSPRRDADQAIAVMEKAKAAASRLPKRIRTDRLGSYVEGIKAVFGNDVEHIQSEGMHSEFNNNLSERLQGTFRDRAKVAVLRVRSTLPRRLGYQLQPVSPSRGSAWAHTSRSRESSPTVQGVGRPGSTPRTGVHAHQRIQGRKVLMKFNVDGGNGTL